MAPSSGQAAGKNRMKGNMWMLDHTLDEPMGEETGRIKGMFREKNISTLELLRLSFQSIGVVFGDLGTSPLYVFHNTFSYGVEDPDDVIGALSLIIYSLTLVALLKYVLVVLRANDNGQGGTFALYSLLCRHARVSTIADQHRTDEQLTTYSSSSYDEDSVPFKIKEWLEAHAYKKNTLFVLVLVGTCMVIGDGILTPSMSVLSAVGGIRVVLPQMSNDSVTLVASIILVGFFSLQHFGTDKVGWIFAPIVFLWFVLMGVIGALNIWKYDSAALKAFSPVYIYRYLGKGGRNWMSLRGIMLSITGIEALFADLSHFPVLAVQVSFIVIVFPCLLLAYIGQAAYILENKDNICEAFYHSIPENIYWLVFVVATAAAIIASQAIITASFSIIKQAAALGCFPRVKIVHTSERFHGQIYIPEINWILMILSIAVTIGFKNQIQIGNAYGTAVMVVMLVTTMLMIPIMLLVWQTHWILVTVFTSLSLVIELVYFSVLLRVGQGGWVPIGIAAIFFIVMYVWHYGTKKRYELELNSRVSVAWILSLSPSLGLVRVPGVGIVYTQLSNGIPHIFSHFITNLPAIHSVVLFVCIKYLPVYTVPPEERIIVKRVGPKDLHMFRCVVRYGYKDLHKRDGEFEKMLFDSLANYIRTESMLEEYTDTEDSSDFCSEDETATTSTGELTNSSWTDSSAILPQHTDSSGGSLNHRPTGLMQGTHDELEFLKWSKDAGVVHLLGNTVMRAKKGSGLFKIIAVDHIYEVLKKVCRENSAWLNIPHESLLNVGQVLYV